MIRDLWILLTRDKTNIGAGGSEQGAFQVGLEQGSFISEEAQFKHRLGFWPQGSPVGCCLGSHGKGVPDLWCVS